MDLGGVQVIYLPAFCLCEDCGAPMFFMSGGEKDEQILFCKECE